MSGDAFQTTDPCPGCKPAWEANARLNERVARAEAINERLCASIRQAFEELGDNDDAGAYLTLKHSGAANA